MAVRLAVIAAGPQSPHAIAARSRAALDLPRSSPAELWVAVAAGAARLVGAFQRAGGMAADPPLLLRRGSGGPDVLLAAGSIHVSLSLARLGALVACDEKRIVNRHVRPLLRALNKCGAAPAHFFGRDWVSVAHRPAAWVGFAHDAATRRTAFEAFVAVRGPFAGPERASFRGRAPGTLESIAGRPFEPERLARAIAEAYAAEVPDAEVATRDAGATSAGPADSAADSTPEATADQAAVLRDDPPWAATADEAIGVLGAGPDAAGVFRVGGDLLVSRDALARLEERAGVADVADLDRVVDETLGAPGVAIDGVRSLRSVRDVIALARDCCDRAPRSAR